MKKIKFFAFMIALMNFLSCSSVKNVFVPLTEFQDCDKCPIMISLPLGEYEMGDLSNSGRENEQPVRNMKIEKPISISKFPITLGDFRLFVRETGYKTEAELARGCWNLKEDKVPGWVRQDYWDNTRMDQDDDHPVVCVSVNDALAYTEWLTNKTNAHYRLPTEAEWEFAARAGTTSKYYFGDSSEGICNMMNWGDDNITRMWDGGEDLMVCDDNYLFTSPVGSFPPNSFGLYDMYGNVWEWVIDCYQENLSGALSNQSVDKNHTCPKHPLRGASFAASLKGTTATYRISGKSSTRTGDYGFRIVRDMGM